MIIKNKEKIIVNYYIKTLEEKSLLEKLNIGDYYSFKGEIKIPSKNTNFNLFNYQNYLKTGHLTVKIRLNTI